MPQLDVSTYLSQFFWLVLCFGILFIVMHYVALPRVSEVLNLRDSKIRQDLQEAEKLKNEAEEIRSRIDSNLAKAREEAHVVLQRAQEEASLYAAATSEATAASLNTQLSEALDNITAARDKAMLEINSEVAATVVSVVRSLGGISISEERALSLARELLESESSVSPPGSASESPSGSA